MSSVFIIYYVSISQNKTSKKLWKLYTIERSRICLFQLQKNLEEEFKLEVDYV